MKRILILNFTRIGDLIQTTPLLAGLKEEFPGCEITLVGNVSFAGICRNLPNIDKLLIFDVKQFIHADGGSTSILDVYRYLDDLVLELREGKYDMLVNLSHSSLTAVMGRMLDIPDVRGSYSTKDGFKVVNDPWLIYFSSLLDYRHYNTFNLVDLYQLGGGVKPRGRRLMISRANPDEEAKKLLEKFGIGSDERLVGIQAGASMKERRWPSAKFAKAADLLSERLNAKIVLFGAPTEKPLVDEVASNIKRPHINLGGATTLEQLIGLVGRCNLLVTNDTATMHIAAAVGTPIVALFLVHAYAAETGPFCPGAIILEPEIPCYPCLHFSKCPHYACLDLVTPEHVAEAASIALEAHKGKDVMADQGRFAGVRIHRTCFDSEGWWDLKPVKKMEVRGQDILGRMYRNILKEAAGVSPVKLGWWDYLSDNFLMWQPETTVKWAEKEHDVFAKLKETSKNGLLTVQNAIRDIKSGKRENVKRYARELEDVDRRIETTGHAHPEVMPLARKFMLGKGNLPETSVEALLEQTKMLYTELDVSAGMMAGMLKDLSATAIRPERADLC